jgi:EAL domain-containing protein (putative c-di-GMP-specific phosphodiesterase class I)
MSSKKIIWICHGDGAFVAEIAFWAGSAGYELVTIADRSELMCDDLPVVAATILELSGRNDEDVDVIEALSNRSNGKVIAVSELDPKTNASLRRLFQAKAVDAILLSRHDFTTRQLADLIKSKENQPGLNRETLAAAIADGHVVVHYQPKVPFRVGETGYSVEALCRIQHPELGFLLPDSFIPLAEAHDLIQDLTDAVTVQAFRDQKIWDQSGRMLRLAINISPRLMNSKAWFERFERRCQEYQVDPRRITLEVTESSSQGGKVLALEILSRLRLKGFLLSIDDFGTGFSSLETLYKLPFGELKIDKGFVFDLLKNSEARALVESTVGLARKLGLKICAEGVETEELFLELRNLQCDDAQGFFISKAIAADAIPPFFNQWESRDDALAGGAGNKLKAIHGLLADLLTGPDDEEDATVVLSAIDTNATLETSRNIAARLPALVLGGDLIGALELVHRAVRAGPEQEFRRKLLSLQAELEHSLLSKDLAISNDQECVRVLGGDSFTIGRESSSAAADAAIPCRWLSRGNKNLKLFNLKGIWQISDLGSTNGHFVDGVRLEPQQPFALAEGETLVEIGKTGSEPAPAWLLFRISASNAVELTFGVHAEEQTDAQSWLFIHDMAGADQDTVAVADAVGFALDDLSFHNRGLWITPRPGSTVQIGGHEFSQAVPLPVGCDVKFGATQWRVEKSPHSAPRPQSVPATAIA